MTREELLALPPTTDLPTLGRVVGVSEPTIRERYRRGELDQLGIRVLRLGAKLRVITADVWRLVGVEPPASGNEAGPPTGPAFVGESSPLPSKDVTRLDRN